MKELIITIDSETGELTYESRGYRGTTCTTPAEQLKALLGQPATERPTKEFHQPVQVQQRLGPGGHRP